MANLKDVKPKAITITLNDGIEREVSYTLNALAELEVIYGSVEKAFDELNKNSMRALRAFLWAGMIEKYPDLTERQVGSLIDMQRLEEIVGEVTNAVQQDMPDEDAEELADPNA